MTLHLVKLCVGVDTPEELADWIARRRAAHQGPSAYEHIHTTRMTPKRRDELLAGGSLYWVIKGVVQVRQPLLDLRPVVDGEGVPRCQIVLAPALVATAYRPMRPFQGWRYLKGGEAPADLGEGEGDLPAELRNELAALGLL